MVPDGHEHIGHLSYLGPSIRRGCKTGPSSIGTSAGSLYELTPEADSSGLKVPLPLVGELETPHPATLEAP